MQKKKKKKSQVLFLKNENKSHSKFQQNLKKKEVPNIKFLYTLQFKL